MTETPPIDPVPPAEPAAAPPEAGRPSCGPVVLGIIVVLVGIPMLVCPGPGVAVTVAGFGMIVVGLGLRARKDR